MCRKHFIVMNLKVILLDPKNHCSQEIVYDILHTMQADQENLTFHIEATIKDILEQNSGSFDATVALQVISQYVQSRHQEAGEALRYAEIYQMTGKAAIITRAWLLNMGQQLKDPSQTRNSIQTYLNRTYGEVLDSGK